MTEGTNEIKRTVVNNRDIPILADVLPAMQAVRQIERRRQWQRDRMTAITRHLTGMPNGKGGEKGLDGAFALLSELDQEHEARCIEYVRYIRAAQKVLNRIESVSMRVFVVMKYMLDMKDTDIMRELNVMELPGYSRRYTALQEAMLDHMLNYAGAIEWVIVGAETGNRKGKVIPKREWIKKIMDACDKYYVPLFMKESLRGIMGDDFRQELPWEVER